MGITGLGSVASPVLWAGFLAFVLAMLALDLGVFHRRAHQISPREAALWSTFWVFLSVVFAGLVWWRFGQQRALEFTAGYLIEKALAVDNLFVFVVVFGAFKVPPTYQHRVLFWGVLGALVMRAVFIFAGIALLERFHFAIYVFGALLIVTAVVLLVRREHEMHPERNPLVRWFQHRFAVTERTDGGKFILREGGRRVATPLLLALVAIEVTDLVFAIDSVPAVLAVSRDPFIVFTSNVLAILGLRSLYFLLAHMVDRFRYLKVGVALVLLFVGAKMLMSEVIELPIWASLVVIAGLLGGAVLASWWTARRHSRRPASGEPGGGDRPGPVPQRRPRPAPGGMRASAHRRLERHSHGGACSPLANFVGASPAHNQRANRRRARCQPRLHR